MSNQSADTVFDALGEPVRRRILELLREGPTPVGRLAERLPVGRPAVSKHLRVLSNAGLIERRSAGTRNLYALAPDGMAAAQQWLVRTWDTALAAYAAEVGRRNQRESPAPPPGPAEPEGAQPKGTEPEGAQPESARPKSTELTSTPPRSRT
jgi:DNA-binding transcriptional ArsR family regulator